MSITPSSDDFKLLIDTLEKASNRTRSVYYFFSIIYIAITLYAVNAFVFSISRARLDEFRTFVTNCQAQVTATPHCANLALSLHNNDIDKKDKSEFLKAFDEAGAKHRQDTYLDEIAANRKFTFPLFGVNVDEDYFWLMNSLIGVIFYFVLISALGNEAELFGFMIDKAGQDEARIRLVLSSQVLSSPSDHHEQRLYRLKTILLRSVLLLPIVTGLLWVCYNVHIFDVAQKHFSAESINVAWNSFRDDYESYPVFSIISLTVQANSIVIMLYGFARISRIVADIQAHHKTGASKLQRSESMAKASIGERWVIWQKTRIIVKELRNRYQNTAHRDLKKAFGVFYKAASQGCADAQFVLGRAYLGVSGGEGMQGNRVAAHMWLNLAANGGLQDAAKLRDETESKMQEFEIAEAWKRFKTKLVHRFDEIDHMGVGFIFAETTCSLTA
jgi:hypothetical protein